MNVEHIPLSHTGQFPRLITDYVGQLEGIEDFTHYSPDLAGLTARADELRFPEERRALLVKVLSDQMGEDITSAQSRSLEHLRAQGMTVCTGHQLCLFGGPVYMLYKIASVIKLAQQIGTESRPVVPVFWMASEDHDIAEIDQCTLFGRRFSLGSKHAGPAGTMPLDGLQQVLDEVGDVLGESPKADKARQLLEKAYEDQGSMSNAFRRLIDILFREQGLLILDASDERLKRSFIPAMKQEMSQGVITSAMQQRIQAIESRGEKVQATPRDINLFYMLQDSRERISKEEGAVSPVEGEKWSGDEWVDLLEEFPDRFSPNVLFRPIYQEFLLPNLAYVGGPGELSYWLQLKEVFEAFEMKMPVVVLRDSFLWMDDRTESRWKELGFEVGDLFRDVDALYKDYAKKNADEELSLTEDKASVLRQFDHLVERSSQVDPTILSFAKAERTRLLKSIDTLEKKMIRAEKKKHGDALARISNIKDKFLPGDSLRERSENFLHWYVRYGDDFLQMMQEASSPLDAGLKVVRV